MKSYLTIWTLIKFKFNPLHQLIISIFVLDFDSFLPSIECLFQNVALRFSQYTGRYT